MDLRAQLPVFPRGAALDYVAGTVLEAAQWAGVGVPSRLRVAPPAAARYLLGYVWFPRNPARQTAGGGGAAGALAATGK